LENGSQGSEEICHVLWNPEVHFTPAYAKLMQFTPSHPSYLA